MDPLQSAKADQQDFSHAQEMRAFTPEQQTFLQSLTSGCSVRQAAEAAGVPHDVPHSWRERDTIFATAWVIAEEAGTDIIEEEAFRRAVNGVQKPVYRSGEVVGHVADYSDTMLMFLLKARRPDRYGATSASSKTAKQGAGTDQLNLKGTRDALISKFIAVHDTCKQTPVSE
ncbi:hypothetical protein [Kordiimonas aquimaris]|uniref:hypothetical protein n=1 Tax=Kordiimonas aquimaris TaxID=707591 RepID=UPI0021D2386C|nr:hypothetical protein [Kordiimonas aquimaris]